MNIRLSFAALALVSLVACTTSDTTDNTRRRTSGTTGDILDGDGTPSSPTAVVVELTASSLSANVGTDVILEAKVWLGSAKTTPVTDGTVVDFEIVTGTAARLRAGQAATTNGKATVNLEGVATGQVEIRARSLTADSAGVIVAFESVGSSPTVVPEIVEITPVTTNYVRVENSTSTEDEAYFTISVVSSAGAYMAGVTVDVTTNDGTVTPSRVYTDANGTATVKYTAGIIAGTITLMAEVKRWGSETLSGVEGSTFIDVEAGAPIIVVASEPTSAQIGIRGSGTLDSTLVAYEIYDKYGNPASDNTLVNFTLQPLLAGASISPPSGTTYGGKVYAVVNAGTQAGTLRVVANVPAANRSVASGKIQIFGGRPSASSFDLSVATSGVVMSGLVLNNLQTELTVGVSDRYGNPPAPGTQVIVFCEAGICGTNDGQGSALDANGFVTIPYWTAFSQKIAQSAATAPVVFPLMNGAKHKWPAVGAPQNGLVTIMALTVGESEYDDLNGNGVFDVGDILTNDPPEPWLDRDESGTFTPGEQFWDFDLNGAWSNHAPSAYRSEQYIWDDIVVTYAGNPAPQILPVQFIDMNSDGFFDPNNDIGVTGVVDWVAFPAGATITTLRGYYNAVYLETWGYVGDVNYNPLPAKTKATLDFGGITGGGLTTGDIELGVNSGVSFIKSTMDSFPNSTYANCLTIDVPDSNTVTSTCITLFSF